MDALLRVETVRQFLVSHILRVELPIPQHTFAMLALNRQSLRGAAHWLEVVQATVAGLFPAARSLLDSASLPEAVALFAALERSRARARLQNDHDHFSLPWPRDPLYRVDPASVTILTHVWHNDEVILRSSSPLRPMSSFSYENVSGMTSDFLMTHTAPVVPEGETAGEFHADIFPPPELPSGDGLVRVVDLPKAQSFLEDAKARATTEKTMRTEMFLLWSRHAMVGRATVQRPMAACIVPRGCVLDLASDVSVALMELEDPSCAESDMRLDRQGRVIWTICSQWAEFVPIAEEYPEWNTTLPPEISAPPDIATSDGIPLSAFSGHLGGTDSWFCLRLRLVSDLTPLLRRRGSQRHEIVAAGLELVYQWGRYPVLPSGDDAFRAALGRLHWMS